MNDPITSLEQARAELAERLSAIDTALAALRGEGTVPVTAGLGLRKSSIGDDKLEAVRAYVRKMRRVRQADIGHELGLNSGTVSVAVANLEAEGSIVPAGKEDRSMVWEAAGK